jgi:hypothetical protein
VNRQDVSTPLVREAALSVVGAPRVECDATIADATGLDLYPQDVAVRRDDCAEIEGQSPAERNENGDAGSDQPMQDGSFGRISSMDCVHG